MDQSSSDNRCHTSRWLKLLGAQVITQVLRDNVSRMSAMASKLDQMASSQIRQDPELAMQAVALMENLGVLAIPLRKLVSCVTSTY